MSLGFIVSSHPAAPKMHVLDKAAQPASVYAILSQSITVLEEVVVVSADQLAHCGRRVVV